MARDRGRPVKNNADYFPHENGMRNDRKLRAVRVRYGNEGYAVYNMLLESLCEAECLFLHLTQVELDILSGDFNVAVELLVEMLEYFAQLDLIKLSGDVVFCPQLDKRIEPLFAKRKASIDNLRRGNPIFRGISDAENTRKIPGKSLSRVEESRVEESREEKSRGENVRTPSVCVLNNARARDDEPAEKTSTPTTSTHTLCLYIAKHLPQVSKLPEQLTDQQAEKILQHMTTLGMTKEDVAEVLDQMENKAGLLRDYRSVYATLKTFMNNHTPRSSRSTPADTPPPYHRYLTYQEGGK